jgi:UDP-glucuronate 4-epimerase
VPDGTILITGAAGFIGSSLADRLVGMGRRVVGVDNFDPYYAPDLKRKNLADIERASAPGLWRFVEADIRDGTAMARICAEFHPDGIIHLAAKAGVRPSIADPVGYAQTNVQGTAVVLEAARAAGCQRVVVASSSSVYGNAGKVPFAEDDDVGSPISPYAATKRACELMGHAHWHLTGMPTGMLRFFTVYGPRQRPDLAIQSFLGKIARGETLRVFGDGSSSRDYTFIDDVVTGVISAYREIERHGFRIWNLGGAAPIPLTEMIATIGRVVGKVPKVEHQTMQPGDVERTWADLSRSGRELGYEPTTAFERGVERQWAWTKR